MSLATYDPIGVDPAPAPAPGRRNVMLVGSLLAAAGGAVLVGAVLGGYLHQRDLAAATNQAWPPEGVALPNVALFVTYIGLALSAFFAHWAYSAIKLDDRRQAYMATSFTVVLGLLFLNGLSYCWVRLEQAAGETPYATHMYAVTVTHALIVVAAMAFWVVVAFRVFGGHFSPRNTESIVAAVVIWQVTVASGLVIWWALWFVERGAG